MFETGGMPSSHSALITGATSGIGYELGFDSSIFALSVAVALIVMYDASGVRKSAGIQAAEINKLSKKRAFELVDKAKKAIEPWGSDTKYLISLADFITNRDR